jgi:hypothetical protein
MDDLIFSVRSILGVPPFLPIGRFALLVSDIQESTVAINVHTGDVVFTSKELVFVGDRDLLIKCLTVKN